MSVSARASTWLFSVERHAFFAEKWICIVSLIAMLVGICFSVAVRYFGLHMPDGGEIAIFAMAPLTFVGAAMCTYTGTNIAVDIIEQAKSPWVRRIGRMVTALAMTVFGAVYYWTALEFFKTALSSGERGLDMGIPVAIPTFFFPLGMALVVLHAVAELIRAVTNQPSVGKEHT
jgi:TRAP-type C4-dicarboxylate transport system permease small subunit